VRAGREELTIEYDDDRGDIRAARWGDVHVARYALAPGTDLTPLLAGLPDGLCSGDHSGIIVSGEITVRFADGSEETARAGDLYHWPAGHTGWSEEGVVFIAVTPLAQVERMETQLAAADG
jgi:hypothetical protein